jgi:hypothetical protein
MKEVNVVTAETREKLSVIVMDDEDVTSQQFNPKLVKAAL